MWKTNRLADSVQNTLHEPSGIYSIYRMQRVVDWEADTILPHWGRTKRHKTLRFAGIIGNILLGNSRFHTRKIFSENYPRFGARALKKFRQSYPRPKHFKQYRFQGAPHYQPARGAHTLWARPASRSNFRSQTRDELKCLS